MFVRYTYAYKVAIASDFFTKHIKLCVYHMIMLCLQIADFGMARDVADDNFYIASGGKVPVKWTAPEVHNPTITMPFICIVKHIFFHYCE